MNSVAIMQPTYIPWTGYFHLILKSDKFVLLDDVQFNRRSWQSRNKILLNNKQCNLSVPVVKTRRDEIISNIVIDNNQDWRSRHLKTLEYAYSKCPYGNEILNIVDLVLKRNDNLLAELNESFIREISKCMGINTPIFKASNFKCGGKRSEHLVNLCNRTKADTYLAPAGSKKYLVEDKFEQLSGIKLIVDDFQPKEYCQGSQEKFISHLSIIDILSYHGPFFTLDYIKRCGKKLY